MKYECDEVADCLDHSDELDCEILQIDPRSYRKEYPPMQKDDQRIPVNVSMSISAISNIHDIKESFQAKFAIILEWYDNRLTFYFLRTSTSSNLIGGEEKSLIWIPPLIFNNTETNEMIVDDPASSMFVHRRGDGEFFDLSNETLIFICFFIFLAINLYLLLFSDGCFLIIISLIFFLVKNSFILVIDLSRIYLSLYL